MKPRAKLTPRLAFGLCGPGGLVWLTMAHAQTGPPAQPASWSATNLPGTSQYQDNYIGGSSAPDISKGYAESSDTQGLARSLEIDAVASALSSREAGASPNGQEHGLLAKA